MLTLAILWWPAIVHAQSIADAEAFTRKLYEAYAHKEPDYVGSPSPDVFSPRLLRLIRRDQKLTPVGEVGVLDRDPICDCQDADGVSNVTISVIASGLGHARADVRFLISAEKRMVTLDLAAVQGQWRIDDILAPNVGSLTRELRNAHPRHRKADSGG